MNNYNGRRSYWVRRGSTSGTNYIYMHRNTWVDVTTCTLNYRFD